MNWEMTKNGNFTISPRPQQSASDRMRISEFAKNCLFGSEQFGQSLKEVEGLVIQSLMGLLMGQNI